MTLLRPQMTNGLHWVRGELDQSLSRTRGMIEQHIENPKDTLPLQQAFVELHQVRGTATMIQCFGVSSFSEEMRQTVHELMHDKLKQTDEVYSALLGSIVQLGDYIDALASGMDDCVLVLHPAINELRVARSKPLLSEPELFAAQMQSLSMQLEPPESEGRGEGKAQALAKKLLPLFQASLLQWLSGQKEARTGLARIGKISEQFASTAVTASIYQLWRVVTAAVEAMLSSSLDESAEVKRLFGATGKQIKYLADDGETAAAGKQGDIAYQLLFYIARSKGQGARVGALRTDLQLDVFVPPVAQIESLRQKIHGPTASILVAVAQEIRVDLAQVKDNIDLAVRGGGKIGSELESTRARMRRVADTLSTLGLQMLQQVISNQIILLERADEASDSTEVWMQVATAILRVELSLDSALFRQLRKSPLETAAGRGELEDQVPHSRDLREGTDALMRESLVSLSKLKVLLDTYIKSGESSGLVEAARMLAEVSSGLLIVENERASMLVAMLEAYVRSPQFAHVREAPERANHFADAIASVEYYIEATREENPQAERMLDNLESLAESLDFTDPTDLASVAEAAPVPKAAAPVAEVDAVDPEIREVFVEEAGEVLAELQSVLPRWSHNPTDREALSTIRRSFHTLKGSGRMVGAASIGNFGWALENLVNRCLDNTISINPDIVETVGTAVSLLPGLIDDFREGRAPVSELSALVERAENLASGREMDVSVEPDMAAIFREDAREKLAQINAWLGEQDRSFSQFSVPDPVVRAFHTLKGSAAVVNAKALSELAGAIETYFDSTRRADQSLPAMAITLMDEMLVTLAEWTEAAGTPASQTHDAKPWIARIEELQSQLPDSAVEQSADSNLAAIFAEEAFDLLQKMEQTINDWSRAPDNQQAPRDLKNHCHTLVGAASMSNAGAIAVVSRALHDRMTEAINAPPLPDAHCFRQLADIIEGGYQLLDRYRDGKVSDSEGVALAERVRNLPWKGAAAEQIALQSVETPAAPAEDLVVEMPAVEEPTDDAHNMLAPELELATSAEAYAAQLDADPGSMFLSEAQELLENIDAYSSAWEQNSEAREPAEQLKQAVHTLEASASMAGMADLGAAMHQFKLLIDRVALDDSPPDAQFFGHLHHITDRLHRVLDDLQHSATPDIAGLLAELENTAAQSVRLSPDLETSFDQEPSIEMPAVEWAEEELSPIAQAAQIESIAPAVLQPAVPTASVAVESAAPAPAVPAHVPEVEVAADFDPELAEIFVAEATEIVESLEKSLNAWQSNPHDIEALRDMQRSLHTLKGGARMSGLEVMGTAAHDMETRVNVIEQAPKSAGADAFAVLVADLESLQTMLDSLQRGDMAALIQAPEAPVAAAQPVSETPKALEMPEIAAAPFAVAEPIAEEAPAAAPPPVAAVPPKPRNAVPGAGWDPALFWQPEEDANIAALRRETARVPVETLDGMLNQAGEISIYRSRLEQHNAGMQAQLNEMSQAINRLREQLRMMDIETEAQVSARGMTSGKEAHRYEGNFDPLEMDRYTRMQELSRALSESVGDIANLRGSMDELASEAETLLLQQGRINTEVQTGLMGTLMVPFSRQVARLQRVVKQTAQETGKQAEAIFSGIESELDRNVLERMTAPLEHLLRNSVVHGLEDPAARRAAGKAEMGQVQVKLWREGTQLQIELRDDGKGLDLRAIRETAIKRGLMSADAEVPDDAIAQFIFQPGFSTAKQLTQSAGRGVGMDVVAAEVKQLGGTLELGSETGKGARFLVRLPLTLSISQALLVGVGKEQFAIPLPSIEGIARIPRDQLNDFYSEEGPLFQYGSHEYRVRYLGEFIGVERDSTDGGQKTVNAILVRLGEGLGAQERHVAVVVDALYGNREVVSKTVGPQVSSINGVSGATILADGSVVLILDVPALAQDRTRRVFLTAAAAAPTEIESAPVRAVERDLVMVVDDSITIRRVTERLLLKNGYRVVTAKDGLDAMALLQTVQPTVMLLDIEMPRADGFEVATYVRNTEIIRSTPIIMITSRSGDKHRERAKQIGVNRYMIKPFQEEQLISEIRELMQEIAAA